MLMVRFGGAGVKSLLTHLCLGSAPLGLYRHQGVGVTQPRKPTCFSLSQAASSPLTLNDDRSKLTNRKLCKQKMEMSCRDFASYALGCKYEYVLLLYFTR